MFKGYITALITPFSNGEIDWKAFDTLVERQIESGIKGLVPCGTTGESPTLSDEEHKNLIKRCVEVANKRVPVIAGTGSNSTAEAIEYTKCAMDVGADAALVVAPYYNKPTQEGLYQHFNAIQAIGLPVIIYNIPGRSCVDVCDDTIARLAGLPNIVGIKDATGDISRPLLLKTKVGANFSQLCGEDANIAGFLAQGGHGCISVTSNIAPELCVALYNAWDSHDIDAFAALRDKLALLHRALFCETSPTPVKYAASRIGLCQEDVRLPLLPASKATRKNICDALEFADIDYACENCQCNVDRSAA